MLHRLTIILITGFWLAMTALLVVRELYPEATSLNAVPAGYVARTVFQHEQSSDLAIYPSGNSPGKEIGSLHIQPRNFPATGKRTLEMSGGITLTLPGHHAKRLAWAAQLAMANDFSPEKLHLDLATQDVGHHVDVMVDFVAKKGSFGAKIGNQIVNETAFTLDQTGFASLMTRAGVPSFLLDQLKSMQGSLPKMEFSAQSSSLTIGGQQLATFLLTLKAGEQTLFDAQLSQLGQVLSVQAPLPGWKMSPFGLTQ